MDFIPIRPKGTAMRVPVDSPPRDAISCGVVIAPWRPNADSSNALAANIEKQHTEEQIFNCLLLKAQDANAPLAELFELALALAHDGTKKPGCGALARQLAGQALAGKKDFDEQGNPLWISLPPSKKESEKEQATAQNQSGHARFFIIAACLAAACYFAAFMGRLPKLF